VMNATGSAPAEAKCCLTLRDTNAGVPHVYAKPFPIQHSADYHSVHGGVLDRIRYKIGDGSLGKSVTFNGRGMAPSPQT
jgi:hypothetical protein